ncbi:MAG: hypothetical protein AAF840_01775 [Bacteroidota bacterium]
MRKLTDKLNRSPTTLLLTISAFSVFFGRAYQYLNWDAPLRSFFWDQGLLEPIVSGWFGRSWQSYATDLQVVENISRLQFGIGLLFIVAAVACLALLKWNNRWLRFSILLGSLFLFFHAVLDTKEHFYHLIQLFEHSLQVGTPLVVYGLYQGKITVDRWLLVLKVLVALTFVAHGLYAIGVYPVPAHFVDMTIRLLGVSETGARTFLLTVGILDLVAALFLFLPRLIYVGVGYCFVWGLLTAFARTAIGFGLMEPLTLLHQQLYQTIYRLPHGLVPLAIWWRYRG